MFELGGNSFFLLEKGCIFLKLIYIYLYSLVYPTFMYLSLSIFIDSFISF